MCALIGGGPSAKACLGRPLPEPLLKTPCYACIVCAPSRIALWWRMSRFLRFSGIPCRWPCSEYPCSTHLPLGRPGI